MQSAEYQTIARNLPGDENWEGSFYERLAEHGVWDEHEFWLIHREIVELAARFSDKADIDKKFAYSVILLYSKIDALVTANFNVDDAYVITGLTAEEIFLHKERLDHAVLSVFSGAIMPESAFDLANPLL